MSVISELIRSESDGTISFGDYTLSAKAKLDNFEHSGDLYKVKTYREITKPEDAQITLELEAGTEYNITINAAQAGVMKTNLGGKLSISVELDGSSAVSVGISKK